MLMWELTALPNPQQSVEDLGAGLKPPPLQKLQQGGRGGAGVQVCISGFLYLDLEE